VIARRWRGWAEGRENADAYLAHFESDVRPWLEATDGFAGATLERVEEADGRTEIVVVTRWASLDAIRAFAGDDVEAAVVEAAARAVLADFDRQVHHIELDEEEHGHLELIDVGALAAAHQPWFNTTLTSVNDAVVRLGVVEGEFHWHKHDDQDEFFLVLEGELLIDLEEDRSTVTLGPQQAFTVPRGAVHRTRAPRRTTILMVEAAGVVPTGD
jgi:mannose-6-phosphate isomerase-like protein (cupin superfamily)